MQADETPKYCENCQHCRVPTNGLEFARCAAPQAPTGFENRNRFLGAEFDKPIETYASVMRNGDHRCGPAAKWFQPKTTEQVAA